MRTAYSSALVLVACLVGQLMGSASCARSTPPPPQDIVAAVRAAIAQNDFTYGEQLIAASRTASGVTPAMLEALSWLARGAVAAKQWETAERYAQQTYDLSLAERAKRPLDQEPHLPTAVGAAIEVLGQVRAARGEASDALRMLEGERQTFEGTSIEKRIRKNMNLLSLEGGVAPPLDLSEYLGATPPTLASLKGKVLVLFFWAHWCADCKQQGPILANLLAKYGPNGLAIVAPTERYGYVAGGDAATPEAEMPYIDHVMRTYYPMLIGQPVPVSQANHIRYGVTSTPTLVLVDRAGIVRLYHPGRMAESELEPLVRKLVGL